MHLVLALPGLLAPGVARDRAAPHLARIITLAGAPQRESEGLDAALAAHYGIRRERDWPLAPIRAAALGLDTGTAYWLTADLVTLEAGSNDVRLHGPVRDLDADDAAALIATLDTHFARDPVTFVAARPDAWFLRADVSPALSTRPLAIVAGRMIRDYMPAGPESGRWRRWQNEIEMLLHAHPVNAAREAAGKAPANGIWLSEGGTLPPSSTGVRTFAGSGIAVALAQHAGAAALPVPPSLDAALAGAAGASTLVVVLPPPADLAHVQSAWAEPAWDALVHGRLATIAIVADDAGDGCVWTARPPGPWQRMARTFARDDLARALAPARGPT